jgi:alanine racemase
MDRRGFIGFLGTTPFAKQVLSKADGSAAPGFEARPPAGGSGSRDARVEVDLGRIGRNLARIKERARVPVMAVVKANAYGHGLVEVSRYLEGQGVRGVMVGKLDEAVRLRDAGIKGRILNFGPYGPSDCGEIIGRDICQTIISEDARYLDEAGVGGGRRAAVDLHIDTGMNRSGVPWEKALDLVVKLSALPRLVFEGVSTTLTEDAEFDREQVRRLVDIQRKAGDQDISLGLRHAASSAGIMQSPDLCLDMVRPGIMIYGYYANAADQGRDALGLEPALRLLGRVTYVKELTPGESVSYHRALVARERMRVATVGLGYSDGYPTGSAGKGSVAIRGKLFRVVAAVTSNHLMVDLDNDPDVAPGDEAVLIEGRKGSGLTADSVAERAGISDYRLLIGLNPLLPRTFGRKEEASP